MFPNFSVYMAEKWDMKLLPFIQMRGVVGLKQVAMRNQYSETISEKTRDFKKISKQGNGKH